LSSNSRSKIRRGLKRCKVEPIDFRLLAEKGEELDHSTRERQGRTVSSASNSYWQKYYSNAAQTVGAEAWGAFVDGELAAYLIGFRVENCSNLVILRSKQELLSSYPNNALLFSYLRHVLGRGEVDSVSYGLEPIQHDMEALDHFKLGLGFEKKPCGQRVEVAPWLRPLLQGPILSGARRLTGLLKRDERIDKLNGLLQWMTDQECRTGSTPGEAGKIFGRDM
jgi:hypothetical protein